MSNRTVAGDGQFDPRIDRIGAVAALALAAALFPLRFLTDELFVEVIPLLVAAASVIYLITVRDGRGHEAAFGRRLSDLPERIAAGATFVGIGALALLATTTGGRSLRFVALASLVGGLVFAQVLFVRDESLRPPVVIAEIVAYALVVRFAALATTPGLIGVDSWTHVTTYAAAIREAGSLSAIADVKYYAAPLYHLLAVVAAAALGTSLRTAVYATLGVAVPASVVLVYLTTRHFLSARWSLFAMAVYAVGDHVLRWGVHLIPTSMGLAFFLAVVYGVTKLSYVDRRGPVVALTVFFGLAVVLTHQVSAFVTLVFLGAAVLAQGLMGFLLGYTSLGSVAATERRSNVVPVFLAVCGITVTNWALTPYRSATFIEVMARSLRRTLATSAAFLDLIGSGATRAGALPGYVTEVPYWVDVLDSLGFFALLTAVILGSLTLVRSDRLSQISLTYVVATAGMLVVTLGFPMFGVNLFLPGRWYAFMYAPMAVVATIGVRYVIRHLSVRTVVACVLLVSLAFPGAMLLSHKATPGDPVFDEHYPRFSYTESELAAVETVAEIHPDSGSTLRTDHPYRTVFRRWQGESAAALRLSEGGTVSADTAVYREYQSHGAPSVRYGDGWVQVQIERQTVCGADSAVLYANGEVRYCRTMTPL